MPFNSGPGLQNNGLIFQYSMFDSASFKGAPTTNLITTNSDGMTGGSWTGYCGTDTNITYNTTEIRDPIGTYTASKLTRKNNNTSCGTSGAWGRLWLAGNYTAGATYTASMWIRAQNPTTVTLAFNDCIGASSAVTTEWKRVSYTGTMNTCGTQGMRGFQFIVPAGSGPVYFWGAQLELGSFATPYQTSSSGTGTLAGNGSRITDGGVLQDLTGNNRIIANALKYTSDNTFFFNGVTDYITVPENDLFNIRAGVGYGVCIEAWIRTSSTSQYGHIFERGPVNSHYSFHISGNSLILRSKQSDGSLDDLVIGNFSNYCTINGTTGYSKWIHVFGLIQGGYKAIYINGLVVASKTLSNTSIKIATTGSGGASIGVYGGYSGSRGNYFAGQIGMVRVHVDQDQYIKPTIYFYDGKNVLMNYRALSGRFKN